MTSRVQAIEEMKELASLVADNLNLVHWQEAVEPHVGVAFRRAQQLFEALRVLEAAVLIHKDE